MPCSYRVRHKIARTVTKGIVQQQNNFRTVAPKRLLQLSAAGEVGEKSDSFSRTERTRPLRPVSRLQFFDFGNVPVERFQRDIS